MYPRTEYEMSEEQLKKILESCKASPCISVGGVDLGRSRQENANMAWEHLGKEMGFDSMTVQPVSGKEMRFFSAIPSETESQKEAREKTEKIERLSIEIKGWKENFKTLWDSLELIYEGVNELKPMPSPERFPCPTEYAEEILKALNDIKD